MFTLDDRCSVTYSGSGRMIPLLLITKYSEMNMMLYEYGMRKADAFVPRHMPSAGRNKNNAFSLFRDICKAISPWIFRSATITLTTPNCYHNLSYQNQHEALYRPLPRYCCPKPNSRQRGRVAQPSWSSRHRLDRRRNKWGERALWLWAERSTTLQKKD
jgi:hypothetical protein